MMDPQIIWVVSALAWLLTIAAAIAHQVVHEVSWHDLEEYCQQKRSDCFGKIFDLRERFSLGTLLLTMVAAGCCCFVFMFSAVRFS